MSNNSSHNRLLPLIIRISIAIAAISLLFLVWHLYLKNSISLEAIQQHAWTFKRYVQYHYAIAVGSYIISYIALAASGIPAGIYLTILGGFLFGALPGALYTNIGATLGATLFFLIMRAGIGSFFQKQYAKQLVIFNENVSRNGALYLLAVRVMPILPFFLINGLAGLTNVSVYTFMWTTSLGIFPFSLVYTFAGKQLTTIHDTHDIFSGRIIFAIVLIALSILIPLILYRTFKK